MDLYSMFLISARKQKHPINNLQKRTDMNKLFILSTVLISALIMSIVACNKDVEGRTDDTTALNPANVDINAGTWKPILLTGPAEFAVAAPSATTTPDYIAQIN